LVAVVVLQEILVLAFEILLEDDAADLEIRMLVSEADFLLAERRVEIRIVVDLAGATDASVERLRGLAVPVQAVRIQQMAPLLGEGQGAFVATKVNGGDKALVAEMAKGLVVRVEVLFGHHSERADGGQRAAVLVVQLVHAVAIDNELAFFATGQIEVVSQRFAWVVIVSVPLAVNAGTAVAAIPVVVLARIVPSSVRHRPSLAHSSRGWVVREDALAVPARGCSGMRRGAGACRRGDQRVV
jgi:hypothetical protein